MGYPTKITTCCYCGARAALVLDRARHELSCSSCGAPLHNLKRLPLDRTGDRELVRPSPAKAAASPKAKKTKKSKKKRGWRLKDAFEDVFDLVEDIFD
ncbi:MAG: hypothetical protein AAGF60_04355 [Pseudomonadota bacterium]